MHGVEHKKKDRYLFGLLNQYVDKQNKTGTVHTMKHLPWKSNNLLFGLCVCMRARSCVRACGY